MDLYGGTYVLIAQFPDHCLPVTFHATRHCVHVPVASNFGKGAQLIRGRLGGRQTPNRVCSSKAHISVYFLTPDG